MSEGTFAEMRPHVDDKKSSKDVDDSSDLYDTIDRLLSNVPNNKRGDLGYLLTSPTITGRRTTQTLPAP